MSCAKWFAFVCLALLGLPSIVSAQRLETKNVLLLYSQEREMGIYAPLDKELRAQLEAASAHQVAFYTEYLDLFRFPDEKHHQELVEYLRIKYASRPMDLIFVVSPLALNFIIRNGDELFPRVPVVFTSVNVLTVKKLALSPNITGIAVTRHIRDSLELALKLQPDTTNVIVPGGGSQIERGWTADLRESLQDYASRVNITYLNDLPMDGLLRQLKTLPPHSIVLFSALYSYDGAGHYFVPEDALDLICHASNAPVYGTDQTYMGLGIVGGHLYNIGTAGAEAGRMGARILDGEEPWNIPIKTLDPNYDTFDARQLNRWGISEARLPAGSIVLFRQPTFWALYKWYVVGCIAIFLLQSVFVLTLIRLTAKLRKSESGLRDLSRNLISAQEDERKRIARELHDDFSQRLALLRVEIDLIGHDERMQNPSERQRFSSLCSMVDDLTQDIHHLSHTLHSSKLQLLGLNAALKDLCGQITKGYPISVEFHAEGQHQTVPADVALCMYRVAQEALNNAVKYSGASKAVLTVSHRNRKLKMRIADFGNGFDTSKISRGLGLASMHERLRLIEGELVVTSRPGGGTELIAEVALVGSDQQSQRAG